MAGESCSIDVINPPEDAEAFYKDVVTLFQRGGVMCSQGLYNYFSDKVDPALIDEIFGETIIQTEIHTKRLETYSGFNIFSGPVPQGNRTIIVKPDTFAGLRVVKFKHRNGRIRELIVSIDDENGLLKGLNDSVI